MANQFVVQLKNEPGAMASLAEALAADLRVLLLSSGEAAGRLVAPPTAYSAKPPMLRPGEPLDL